MSDRYISDRFLPDKAIDLIDEAGSKVRLRSYVLPPNLKDLEEELDKVRAEKMQPYKDKSLKKRSAKFRDREKTTNYT